MPFSKLGTSKMQGPIVFETKRLPFAFLALLELLLLVSLCTADRFIPNPADYVLPLIGTTNGGAFLLRFVASSLKLTLHLKDMYFLVSYDVARESIGQYSEVLIGATLPHGMVKVSVARGPPNSILMLRNGEGRNGHKLPRECKHLCNFQQKSASSFEAIASGI